MSIFFTLLYQYQKLFQKCFSNVSMSLSFYPVNFIHLLMDDKQQQPEQQQQQ